MDVMKSKKNSIGRIEIKMEDIKDSISFSVIKKDYSKLVFSFVKDNVTYFFKSNSKYSYDQNEVLATILLTQNGVKTNETEFCSFLAKGKKYDGIISKDIIQDRKNTELINYEHVYDLYHNIDFCVDFIYRRVKDYCEDNNLTMSKNLYNDLSILSLIYYITGQQDYTHRNVEFEIKKNENGEKVLSLMPFIDKSITFFSVIDDENTFNKISLKKIKENPKKQTHQLVYGFMFDTYEFELYTHNRMVKELAINILKNKKLENVFRKFANFDFRNAIKEYTISNPDFKFDPDTVQKAIILFENNREDLVKMVKIMDKNFFAINSKIDNNEIQFE